MPGRRARRGVPQTKAGAPAEVVYPTTPAGAAVPHMARAGVPGPPHV
ncbi:hypothetical protein GCM10009530_61180 [Microbispora corallina]|uniref:Uncharacterized protein n=1 Tax=Microbispora corallina TaxID=83302 RepID=A0ABQ4G8B6_9ACTN|nr:hypothetical protein [Microbispora corallina]GIH43304.1 hypothetical protein Mco01_63040 [Microbispora corallina]